MGPFGLNLITDDEIVEIVGEFGLVILMFFIGMEISLKDFIGNWRVAIIGTGLQILISVLLIVFVGVVADWSLKRIILIGFIISLSISAVVIKLIEVNGLAEKRIGQHVISILLTQDVIIAPMIIVMSFISGEKVDTQTIILQLVGGSLIVAVLIYLLRRKSISLPFASQLQHDHELQVELDRVFRVSTDDLFFRAICWIRCICGWLVSECYSFH